MAGGQVGRSQSLLLLAALVGMGCSLALTILAGRHMTAADFGIFALVATIFSLARDATDLGTTALACRATARDPAQEVRAIEDLLGWRLLPCALIAAGCVYIGLRRGEGIELAVFAAAGAVILYSHNNALYAAFQVRQMQHIPARIVIVTQAITLALALAGMAAGWMATGTALFVPALIILREGVAIAWSKRAAGRLIGTMPHTQLSRDRLRRVFTGGISIYALAALCLQVVVNSGTFLVEMVGNPTDLGVYAAAYRPMTPLLGLCWLLAAPLSPVLSHMAATDRAAFRRQVDGSLALALGAGAVLAATGVLLAPDIIPLFYGNAIDGRAVTCLAWLMPALPASALLAILAPAMLAQQREQALMIVGLAAMILCLATAPMAIGAYGPAGAAMTVSATLGLASVPLLAMLRPSGVRLSLALVPALVSTLALQWIVPLLPNDIWVRMIAGSICSATALVGLWYAPGMRTYRREQDAASFIVGAPDGA